MRAAAGPSSGPSPRRPEAGAARGATAVLGLSSLPPTPGRSRPGGAAFFLSLGLSFHCAVGRMQPPPLFMSLERRARERLAKAALAFYYKSCFP